jgi:hypothetical protein
MLNKNPNLKKAYQSGLSDAERKIIPVWKQILADLENEKDEIIEAKNLEIMNLQIQLDSWKSEHEKAQKTEIKNKKEKSLIRREWNKIDRFKEEVKNRLSAKLNEDAEKVQDLFILLGEKEYEPEENIKS